jgi:hypothetical protein
VPLDPSLFYGATLYPSPGWLRVGRINSVLCLVESYDVKVARTFSPQEWAIPVPAGPKQSTLHARGTQEIAFQVLGELTGEGSALLLLLSPQARGLIFPITVQQQDSVDVLSRCLLESFQVTAQAGGPVKFTLSGKCLDLPTQGTVLPWSGYQHPVPGWATGAPLVEAWTFQHATPLTPVWRNGPSVLPAYYRVGSSGWRGEVTTRGQLAAYSGFNLGVGLVELTGLVGSQGVNSAQQEPRTYTSEVTNFSVTTDPLTPGVVVQVYPVPLYQGYPDGI